MYKKLQQPVTNETNEVIDNESQSSEIETKETEFEDQEGAKKDEHPKVLVVSSNKEITDRLSLMLGDAYEVVHRKSIAMIFQIFSDVKTKNVDLIIYYDGNKKKDLSILTMMKKYPRFANVPLIILSQEISDRRRKHYLENDLNDYIDMQSFSHLKQLVNSKIKMHSKINSIINYSLDHNSGLDIVSNAQMEIRSLAQVAGCARTLKLFTNATITQERAFFEIILNSLEHGQLGIDKEKRKKIKNENDYENYLEILCNRNKEPIIVTYEKLEENYRITVIDGGEGFDYKKYLKTNLSDSLKDTEKGIAIANSTKGIELNYKEPGNIVEISIPHQEKFKLWH